MAENSSHWKAIDKSGNLVAPKSANTLKFDYTVDPGTENTSKGMPKLVTTLAHQQTNGDPYAAGQFEDMTADGSITPPEILKALAIYPDGTKANHGDYIYMRNKGERLPVRGGVEFIVIIDEEHSNNTAKAKEIIDAFSSKNIIRASATAIENKRYEFFEIDEVDVIGAGLITKALYVNEGVADNTEITDDYDYLLDLADAKRKEIAARYKDNGKNIRPLVLIQFPNGRPETITAVEQKLESMGYSYNNGMVSKWMSEDKKDLPDNLTKNDGIPVFLLMKQAISTGWDCPRAKILVKLREGMSESFEIQTIGRIRRMPEAKHYEDDLLDFCYVYTFDEKYKAGLLSNMDKAYETRRLFLKNECKTFTLEKEIRDLDIGGLGERDVLNKIYDALVKKYKLTTNKADNKLRLMAAGYQFGDDIIGHAIYGEFVRTDMVAESTNYYTTRKRVNTHKHGIELLHSVDAIKSTIGMQTTKVKTILERLFRKGGTSYKKLLLLDTAEFYAFIINNEHKLKEEFREVTANIAQPITLRLNPKKSPFHIPHSRTRFL